MRSRKLKIPCLLLAVVPAPAALRGDQVVTGGINFPDAKIVNLEQGKLQFRASNGRLHSVGVGDIELMIVDRSGVFEDFNQAERFLFENQPQKAIARYERTLRLSQEYWPDIVAARLVTTHDRVGQVDRAVQYWIRLLNGRWSGLAAAAALLPKNLPTRLDGRAVRAVDLLANEIRKETDVDRRAMLEVLRFEVLRRCGDPRAEELAPRIASLSLAAPARGEGVYAIVLAALEIATRETATASNFESLDRAIRDCPNASLAGFLLLKGRLMLRTAKSREEIIRAAWCLMRVAVHMPDDMLAPAALVETAEALRRIDRRDQATSILKECLAKKQIDEPTRQRAESMLRGLRPSP